MSDTKTAVPRQMTGPGRERGRTVAAVLLVVAAVQYWIVEAVSASAWVSPRYSYFDNFISDLGVDEPRSVLQGRLLTSPLHAMTNFSFVVLGALTAIAFLVIAGTIEEGGRQRAIRVLGVVAGGGAIVVAAFPENTIFFVHAVGAFSFVLGGLALLIVTGAAAPLLQVHRAIAPTLTALGSLGVVASLALVFVPGFDHGITERVGGYSFLVGMVVLAIALLATRPRQSVQAERNAPSLPRELARAGSRAPR